jgi:hypothetical protein
MRIVARLALSAALVAVATPIGSVAGQELGTIAFPNSGSAAAQAPFLEGVKSLHSFQFDEAAVAFQRAQQADPSFAMAYCEEDHREDRADAGCASGQGEAAEGEGVPEGH